MPEADVRNYLTADVRDISPMESRSFILRQPDTLFDDGKRKHVPGVPQGHEETLHDRQREGESDGYRSSLASFTRHVDCAAQAVNRPSYHVHSDAPAGDVRHFLCRRESRMKNEAVDFLVTTFCIRGNEAQLDCL